jgi:hypothetical protein
MAVNNLAKANTAAPGFNPANAEPIYELMGQTEQNAGTPTLVGYRVSTPLGNGLFRNDIYDVSGNFQRTTTSSGKEDYGVPDLLKLAATAVGANALGAGLGQASAFGPSVGAGTGAGAGASSAGAGAAAAGAAPATTQLTPAALEAAIGTPGYGYNAAAAASGITPSAGFAGMSAAEFGMSGAQTAAYDAAIAAGAAPGAALQAANAAPGIGAPQALTSAATSAAANAAGQSAGKAIDPYSFIIPAAASLIGGVTSANAAKSAAQTSAEAANRAAELQRQSQQDALALQKRMYEEGVARQQPWYQAGVNALAQIQGRTDAMPAAFQFRPEQLTTDPGYGFRLSEGLKALERSAAARGGLLSGGTGKALTRYGQEMASQEFGNAYNRGLTEYNALRQREAEGYNRLAGIAGVGGTTAQQLSAAGQQYGQQASNLLSGTATNIGNIMMNQGQTGANALLAQGSAYQRTAGDIASLYARMYGPQPTYMLPGGGG